MEFSHQRDYVLRHQRISHCHTGNTFVVEEAMFPEFQDFILPHVMDHRKWATQRVGP